jgi:hypothetical protein
MLQKYSLTSIDIIFSRQTFHMNCQCCLNFTDTELLYTTVINRILSLYGKEFTWENKASTMGFHTSELVRYIIDTFELPLQPTELTDQLVVGYADVFPSTKLLPGDFDISHLLIFFFSLILYRFRNNIQENLWYYLWEIWL